MPASLLGRALKPLPKPIEMDPAAAEAGQLAESQPGAQEGEDVIPPGQGDTAEQSAGFFGSIGAALGFPE
jgi:hypothetical protein